MLEIRSMRLRLSCVIIAVSVITTVCIGGFFAYTSVQQNEQYIAEYRDDLRMEVDKKLTAQTQGALEILQQFYELQAAGVLSEEDARKSAADVIRNLRYDNGQGYFWIDTEEGVNVVLLGSADEGVSRWDSVDPAGRHFVQEMIAKGKEPGGGFTDLMFPKPNSTVPLPKRNYTAYFEPYHWVVGTGIWLDEIDNLVTEWEKELSHQLQMNLLRVGISLLLLQILFVVIAFYVGNSMARPIGVLTRCLYAMGEGKINDEELRDQLENLTDRSDEIGKMLSAMKEMHVRMSEYQQTILSMAHKDALTGLANRRYFQECVAEAGQRKGFVIISLDLDHFKEVNDEFGHQSGDAALLIFAEVMKSIFTDALNVRMGGDEFLVFLTHQTSLEEVEKRLERFMAQLTSIYKTDKELSRLTVSAGIAASFEEELPIDILLQYSDIALYAAKTAGRSCYMVYKPED